MMSDAPRTLLSADIVPAWASAYGEDRYGIWAELHVVPTGGGDPVVQRTRYIQPGTFWMGSPNDEPERDSDEGPRHLVTITRGFWLADTACTQALWVAVMEKNPSRFKGDERPVDSVSWEIVREFLGKLPKGCGARLPTEGEWEWCADGQRTYRSSSEAVEDPAHPPRRSLRVLRGGSWGREARACRSACRHAIHPRLGWDHAGFRLALSSGDRGKPDR